jgi:hypothetical protein
MMDARARARVCLCVRAPLTRGRACDEHCASVASATAHAAMARGGTVRVRDGIGIGIGVGVGIGIGVGIGSRAFALIRCSAAPPGQAAPVLRARAAPMRAFSCAAARLAVHLPSACRPPVLHFPSAPSPLPAPHPRPRRCVGAARVDGVVLWVLTGWYSRYSRCGAAGCRRARARGRRPAGACGPLPSTHTHMHTHTQKEMGGSHAHAPPAFLCNC